MTPRIPSISQVYASTLMPTARIVEPFGLHCAHIGRAVLV